MTIHFEVNWYEGRRNSGGRTTGPHAACNRNIRKSLSTDPDLVTCQQVGCAKEAAQVRRDRAAAASYEHNDPEREEQFEVYTLDGVFGIRARLPGMDGEPVLVCLGFHESIRLEKALARARRSLMVRMPDEYRAEADAELDRRAEEYIAAARKKAAE